MEARRIFQVIMAVALLAASFAATDSVLAWSRCGSQVTVQSGDTLEDIAVTCGVTVKELRDANPRLYRYPYAGQVLVIPGGGDSGPDDYPWQPGGSTYVVQPGDTLGGIAMFYGIPLRTLLAANPQIWDPSLIYPGQVIYLPPAYGAPYHPYYQPAPNPQTYYPPTQASPIQETALGYGPGYSGLRITYKYGLLVRTGPARTYPQIVSPLLSSAKDTVWRYRKNSVTVDSEGFVWVEVTLSQPLAGYSTGWIIVKNGIGEYHTIPNIDP
jgi:LysM repeat protein